MAAEFALFDQLVDDANYIGEIGLDFSREGIETRETQLASFNRILTKIVQRRRFVTLHSRGAEREVLDLLTQHKMYSVVFHWYTGDVAILKKIVEAGHFFSVNTAMVNNERSRRIIAHLPKERLLSESDGPHIRIDGKAANPKHMNIIHQALVPMWNISSEEVEEQITKNFESLTTGKS